MGRHNSDWAGARDTIKLHRHWTKWQELASLVWDGVSYSRAYVKGRDTTTPKSASYQPVMLCPKENEGLQQAVVEAQRRGDSGCNHHLNEWIAPTTRVGLLAQTLVLVLLQGIGWGSRYEVGRLGMRRALGSSPRLTNHSLRCACGCLSSRYNFAARMAQL